MERRRGGRDRVVDGVKVVGRVAGESPRLARAGADLAAELAKVVVGKSEVGPGRGDRRFADPTWTEHPAYHRLNVAGMAEHADEWFELGGARATRA